METEESRVAIELHSRIDDNGELEESTTKTTGVLYTKRSIDVVAYTENLDENGENTAKNLLTIQPEKVSVKRSGAIKMHQQFIYERTTECLLQHLHGAIHMDIYTKSIRYQPMDDYGAARLTIHYLAQLNGQDTRNHQLTWSINKY